MIEIHAAVEALLGETVPRFTIKNRLANNSRGDGAGMEAARDPGMIREEMEDYIFPRTVVRILPEELV